MEITNTILFIGLGFLWIVFMIAVAYFKTVLSDKKQDYTLLRKHTYDYTKSITVKVSNLYKAHGELSDIVKDLLKSNNNINEINTKLVKSMVQLNAELELLNNKLNSYINE